MKDNKMIFDDTDDTKMAEEFIADVEKAFEILSEMGFEEFAQIS